MAVRRRFMTLLAAVGILTGVSAAAPASGATKAQPALAGGVGGTLTIANAEFLWTCGFSPFNPSADFLSVGPVYETLMFVDSLDNAKVTPWLATSYAWSNGNKVLTFTIRKGIKWTDGQPFTPADVAFTFNLIKKYPALDLNTVWSVLSSVSQKGTDQVAMTFKTAAVPYFYYIADQVAIVPEHIWSTVKNPVTYSDAKPIGTGPFTVSSCTPQNVSYVRNAHFWQPGLPKIAKIEYPAFTSNPPANTLLATGGAQWGGQFIPNLRGEYLSKSPDNHFWFPPVVNVSIFINQTVSLLNNVAVRQALAFAVDRSRVAEIGEYGYEPAANQAGVVLPTFQSWLDSSQLRRSGYSYDPQKAISILEKAGFKRGSGGIFVSPQGKPLSFSIINQSAYTDWVAALQVVSQELSAVGIKLNVENLAGTDYSADLYDGKFQLRVRVRGRRPQPVLRVPPVAVRPGFGPGWQAGRHQLGALLQYGHRQSDQQLATTTSAKTRQAILDKLQGVLLQDVPLIPVTEQVDWDEYSTAQFTGWPSAADPYAQPYAYVFPDWEQVLLQLHAK